ncbi:MAG: AraC family transcriptional regulator [Nitratireductor sp.]|uniref:AraC family transcriptional regulator n=1 Tax=Nitratireductor sp. TaxID=1872084 RepID=UPI00262E23F8|nr:AraC family transcriptional regulator [Nitratireductor sp.]MCV0352705.1 AraC family transcriptional regulator [Nitratireductor sp.]
MFGIHVLRKYGDAARPKKSATGGLSLRNEKRIREHLAEDFRLKLSVADLAGVYDLSPGPFIVAFTNTSGERPHRHLINLRLDYARCLLTEGDMQIPRQIPGQIPGQIREIARLSGFSCQSHLTTSLRKHRGVPPRKPRSER